jgi:hypothetical protein
MSKVTFTESQTLFYIIDSERRLDIMFYWAKSQNVPPPILTLLVQRECNHHKEIGERIAGVEVDHREAWGQGWG